MPLPTQMQEQLEYQLAITSAQNEQQTKIQSKTVKLEALRMAKEIAMENHRAAPAGTVLSATDIVALASELEAFTSV
jgi:hemolysin activation/secretion protein